MQRLLIRLCTLFALFGTSCQPSVFGDDDNELKQLIAKVRPSVATIRVQGRDGDQLGIGTGFVIDSSGLIATNFHVINEGRPFTVELSGKKLEPIEIVASDRNADLALIRVQVADDAGIPSLELSDEEPQQGQRVSAFGNPLGLENSVVDGIVSAMQKMKDGRELIQLAIPIEPGNSGGPLVDRRGRVVGIINMKSAVDENLGFAIPIANLQPLRAKPNPVAMNRWLRLGVIDPKRWKPLMGATWQERGGLITARGMGKEFGGRSLCLSMQPTPELPFEVAVNVKLNDESGAAGLAFYADGGDKHYGFYPSSGRLRLTCFKGPSVYSWQVLEEIDSEHYLPNQWNRLRLRIESDQVKCFVNGHLVVATKDKQLTSGKIGLVKFRQTQPDFKGFEVGEDLEPASLSPEASKWFEQFDRQAFDASRLSSQQIGQLSSSSDAASTELMRRALELETRARDTRRLANDIQRADIIGSMTRLLARGDEVENRLFWRRC